jgi:ferritin-like metal-binding protein YciE
LFETREQHSFRIKPSEWHTASLLELTKEDMMQANSLRELYVAELRDLYSAETQLVKALPKMAKASSNAELRQGFEEHLRQTSEHVSRLEQIFDMIGEKATGKKCVGMEGLVKEGAETMKEDYDDTVMDAAIIGAAQRVEHYEIAAYGTVRAFAEQLGEDDHVSLIEQTLNEEKQTDEKLTQLAEQINSEASAGEEGQESETRETSKQSRSTSRRAA